MFIDIYTRNRRPTITPVNDPVNAVFVWPRKTRKDTKKALARSSRLRFRPAFRVLSCPAASQTAFSDHEPHKHHERAVQNREAVRQFGRDASPEGEPRAPHAGAFVVFVWFVVPKCDAAARAGARESR
jgi:hypothetical protein